MMESRLGIVAGAGDLPVRVAEYARASGRQPFIIGVKGFAEAPLMDRFDGAVVSIGEIGRQITLLRDADCAQVVFAGIVRRPDFSALKLDLKGAQSLPAILAAAAKGDDALLRAVVQVYEGAGFAVVGADEVCADLMAPAGAFGKLEPGQSDWRDIELAREVVEQLGKLDVGQGAVCRDGVVLAVEAQEGTDAMLVRCAGLDTHVEGARGVLVKAPKPQQERRIDLPTIGVETVKKAAAAGLAGIAVQAGGALVLDRNAITDLADELGLFVVGFSSDGQS